MPSKIVSKEEGFERSPRVFWWSVCRVVAMLWVVMLFACSMVLGIFVVSGSAMRFVALVLVVNRRTIQL
jgi:uncharacterized membrane protein YphA (DoxX/SURF4 family)